MRGVLYSEITGSKTRPNIADGLEGVTWNLQRTGPAPIYINPDKLERMSLRGQMLFREVYKPKTKKPFNLTVYTEDGEYTFRRVVLYLPEGVLRAEEVFNYECEEITYKEESDGNFNR